MKVFAHRGASADWPENTLMAFRQGWHAGAAGAELDVRLTADGEAIVCHDATALRTTGQDLVIARETAVALRSTDATSWKGPLFPREPLPLLGEVLAELPTGRELLIEIKCGAEVIPALQALHLPAAVAGFLCFDADVLAAVRRVLPRHRCLLNIAAPRGMGRHNTAALVGQCHARGFAGVSLGWHRGLDRSLVETLHAAGLQVAVWTVDHESVARTARSFGVDVLMTNKPYELLRDLSRG